MCGEPPEYSLDEEVINCDSNEKKDKIVIYTQGFSGTKEKYRYTLFYKKMNGV